jgi:hypothetical protein
MGEWREIMGEDCGRLAETMAAIQRIEALVLGVSEAHTLSMCCNVRTSNKGNLLTVQNM